MSFVKLDSGIVNSSLWVQPHDVLRVWIWFLSQADARGVVRTAAPALAHACMVPLERTREILILLESPDPDSRSSTDDGRRIERIEGGWRVVNYLAYRDTRDTDGDRERKREWDREHRPSGHKRQKGQSENSPTKSDAVRRSPTQAEAEAEATEQKQDQERGAPFVAPPPPEPEAAKAAETPKPDARGSRLPAEWFPGPELTAWAQREFPDVDHAVETAKFADYWLSKPGKDGRKANWDATWRNWIRRAADSGPPRPPRAGPQRLSQQQTTQFPLSKTATAFMALQQRIDNAESDQPPAGLVFDSDHSGLPAPARART